MLAAGTANGVFGAKVMWGFLPDLEPFPEPRFVWLRRRDRVAQAVSFAKAVQTGQWHHWDPPPQAEPEYRFDEIDTLRREIEELDRSWEDWFRREKQQPLELSYEELVADPRPEVIRVLEFLGADVPPDLDVRPLTVARPKGIADDWARRYRDER